MALHFFPRPGAVLLCDFDAARTRALPFEMTKRRPVVVVSRARRRMIGAIIVVPLSTSPPTEDTAAHVRIPAGSYPFLSPASDSWAKCDCLAAVSPVRLDRLRRRGRFVAPSVTDRDLAAIHQGLIAAVGAVHLLR